MPTSQQMADDALSIDRVERRLMRTLDDLYRDAKERAAPIIEQLAQIEATRPPAPRILSVCPSCARVMAPGWPCACAASPVLPPAPPSPPAPALDTGRGPALIVTRGDGKALPDQPGAVRAFINQATRPRISLADQMRQAILSSVEDEPPSVRYVVARLLPELSDASLEAMRRKVR